jgi:hypothetical protein
MTTLKSAVAVLLSLPLLLLALPEPQAGDAVPFSARAGLELAVDAASTWAPDSRLIFVENDEDVRADGTALRWGYLFYSGCRGKSRGYTLRNGTILEASDLDFDFEAPPLPDTWIDSQAALIAAEKNAGKDYRRKHKGRLSTMLLIRGAFHENEPNASTWVLLYTSDTEPALHVVIDAAKGKVVKTWRG